MHGFERKSNLGIERRSQPSFIARVFPRGDMSSEHLDEQHVCRDVAGRFSNKRWVSSINFVNTAGLRPPKIARL
jgi:hypothetical protein